MQFRESYKVKASFDNQKFYSALDNERASRNLTWKQVAADSGVSASTLTRMAQGKRPDVDGLAALLAWSGLQADSFMEVTASSPDPLTQITILLRGDDRLSNENKNLLEGVLSAVYGSIR
jgi:transcriptional regulator with XRE-family HTH domain